MTTNKPWERPWSMDEIISNADNWNLSCDVALLTTIKTFADNLQTKTTEINNNLLSLTNNLDETSLRLNIAQNKFQSLRNTQFIESRVYEDDETFPQTDPVAKPKDDEKTEEAKIEDVRFAVLQGLKVLDTYFDRVEVTVSDSDDDDVDANLPNYMLRPKDLYIERPLPYVIGSEEWQKSAHVGLDDSSTDSDTEKASDKFSDSDSDDELPVARERAQEIRGSDTSSELSFSQQSKVNAKEVSRSSGSDTSVPVSGDRFAEQLAAKLGHVITQEYAEPEVNKRPIQTKSQYSDIFFDEPPPLDEKKGLFSGGKGLFDDDDDDDAYSTPKESKRESPKAAPRKTTGGLFDEESDDDIFGKKLPIQSIKSPVFNQEPPPVDEGKKKPVGGVSIFGGGNLFDKQLLRKQPSSDDEEKEEEGPKIKTESEKKIDLFGDDDPFEAEPKFEPPKSKEVKKINLFDSDEESDDLFGQDKPKPDEDEPKSNTLFDDTKPDDNRLFESQAPTSSGLFDDDKADETATSRTEEAPTKTLALFDEDDNDDLFSPDAVKKFTSSLFDDDLPKVKPADETKPRLSLFDSPPPEPDDLFADKPEDDLFGGDLFSSTPEKVAAPVSSMRLFDPSPPPDDGDDTKSDTLSECDDLTSDNDVSPLKTSIFSEEPPSIEDKPKPGKLQHNLNINVGALMPGSLPPKAAQAKKEELGSGDEVEVLHSVTKDRARVPLRRRPSTRRGRQAALRVSTGDFQLRQDEQTVETQETKPTEEVHKSRDDLLEVAAPKPASRRTKTSLFDDDDNDDDDLFSGKKASVQAPKSLAKSLFNDNDEDDDDIFKSFSSGSVKKTESKVAVEKKLPKVNVKKLENTKPDDDPLSALLK